MRQTITLSSFTLESGETMREVPVAYRSWGSLNAQGDNAVIVCHALTGNPNIADWWSGLFGEGRVFDPERHFIISVNVLGSPYGTASPLSTNPATGAPYGPDFPRVTIRDTVQLQRQLLERLGVNGVALAAGGSMGGMQVLEWAFERTADGAPFVRSLVPVAVGGRHSAWQIGWSEAQRQAIYADSQWCDGRYDPDEPPSRGLASARMMAMIAYRSYGSFAARFGREVVERDGEPDPFTVETYLRYQGEKLTRRFDANCYVRLTQQMDSHDVARGRGSYREVLQSVEQPALVVGINTDVLYPLEEQEELAAYLPQGELQVLASKHGHDAFLIETSTLNEQILAWRSRCKHTEPPSNAHIRACG